MKAWIQRVRRGKVSEDGRVIGEIGQGYVALLGVKTGDSEADAKYLADKTAALRIFADEQGRMNRSIIEVGGSVLAVSQFTLHADTSRGNRPSFMLAAPAGEANRLYEHYVDCLRHILGPERVATGRFQAMMVVEIVNDGPVTIELKSRSEEKG
jgi:D-tyrosyl-tRNA(Tyr) deacylase